MLKLLKIHWPPILLFLLNVFIFATNYIPGTYLTGWDNLHPEFAPLLNIKRSLFAVWQEYQSLGLLGGMGHASDLARQIYVLFLSFVAPTDLIRYITTCTSLFLGGIGTYYLARLILANARFDNNRAKAASFLGALFYTLNIATIQTFYVPFEAFITHFAALPWLILASMIFLTRANIKSFAFLVFVLILASPSAYIPTLFVAAMIAITIYAGVNLFLVKNKKPYIRKSIKLYATIALVNSFWLLPFLYFTLTNSSVNVEAKMNQMATETIFAQNREFGNLLDVALLRGFWFNNVDPDLSGDFAYMLSPWRAHFENIAVIVASLFVFSLAIVGALLSVLRRRLILIPFVVLFAFAFTMLATDTPVLTQINELFRKLPLFNQAFRFPFTKFNSLAALTYAIMLAVGFSFITEIISSRIRKFLPYILFVVPAAAILFVSYPVFSGNLFYAKETINIPDEYFKTGDYLNSQPRGTRIANLPQPTFWGWTFYRWGYGGSGFLWYDVEHPILDRAFDVWSATSENYYFELSQALYSKSATSVEDVLNKYQITHLLLDENVIYPHSPKSLFFSETEALLSQIPTVHKDKSFGNITIYKVELNDRPNSFVFTTGTLPRIETSSLNTVDKPYMALGNYVSLDCAKADLRCQVRPFASLFSQKTSGEQDFELYNREEDIETTRVVDIEGQAFLNVPEFSDATAIKIFSSITEGGMVIYGDIKTPDVLVDRQKVYGQSQRIEIATLPEDLVYPFEITTNGVSKITVSEQITESKYLGTSFLTQDANNVITVTAGEYSNTIAVPPAILDSIGPSATMSLDAGTHEISVIVPKVNDSYLSLTPDLRESEVRDCNNFRGGRIESNYNGALVLTTVNDSACISYFSPTLLHRQGYVVFVENSNISGRPMHFWILNEDYKSSLIDTYLDGKLTNAYVIAPQGSDGRGYSFHFDNISIGGHATENTLSSFEVYPIPYDFITDISINTQGGNAQARRPVVIQNVSHPNESLYIVNITGDTPTTLVLSQSYDKGWAAYRIANNSGIASFAAYALPFVFGERIGPHFKVNNWENGWEIDTSGSQKLVIVYLPQYLEYAGFAILAGLTATTLLRTLRFRKSQR